MNDIVIGALVTLFVGMGATIAIDKSNIGDLETELANAKLALSVANSNFEGCDKALTETNDLILANAIEYEEKLKKVKVITVEKVIPKYITLEKGDCNETSTVIDFVRDNL